MFQNMQRWSRLFSRQGQAAHRRGQTSVMLIVLIAVSLIMYAITLNLGKIAEYKSTTTVGANLSAASMASLLASYGQSTWKQTLGGKTEDHEPKYCESTNFMVMVFVVILTIVITIITWGAAWPLVALAIAAMVLAIAALVVNLTVIQPGLTSLWNKMQKDLSIEDQIVERGISSGLQAVVNDPETISDHFDMDLDGLWVDENDVSSIVKSSQHKDKISRFAFFYTRRMELIIPRNSPGIDSFSKGLAEFVYDDPNKLTDPINCAVYPTHVCCDPRMASIRPPQCNQLRCGSLPAPPDPNGCCGGAPPATCAPRDLFGLHDPLDCSTDANKVLPVCNPCCAQNPADRPKTCVNPGDPSGPRIPIPATEDAIATMCQPGGPYWDLSFMTRLQNYPYVYDPDVESASNNNPNVTPYFVSFREFLGKDDENRLYQKRWDRMDDLPPNNLQTVIDHTVFPPVAPPSITDVPFVMQDATGFDRSIAVGGLEAHRGVYPFLWEWSKWSLETDNITAPMPTRSTQCHWCDSTAVDVTTDPVLIGAYPVSNCTQLAYWPASNVISNANEPAAMFNQLDLKDFALNPHCSGVSCCVNRHNSSTFDYNQLDWRVTDVVAPPKQMVTNKAGVARMTDRLAADDDQCGLEDSKQDPNGLYWKPGGDQYCTEDYASSYYKGLYYQNCQKMNNQKCLNNTPNSCSCMSAGVADPSFWPEDPLDSMVYGLPAFIEWAKFILGMTATDLNKTFLDWYPSAANWIAYACTGCTAGPAECDPAVCNSQVDQNGNGHDGWIITWRDQLQNWYTLLDNWLTQSFANNGAWCVPVGQADMSTNEWNALPDKNGDLNDVIACLNWNSNNPAAFNGCVSAIDTNSCSYASCNNLPRSLVPGFNSNGYQGPSSADLTTLFATCMKTCDPAFCNSPADTPPGPLPVSVPNEFTRSQSFVAATECNADGTWVDKTTSAFYQELDTLVKNSWCFQGSTYSFSVNTVPPPGTPVMVALQWADLLLPSPPAASIPAPSARDKLADSATLAVNQSIKFQKRSAYLTTLVQKARDVRAVFYLGWKRFDDFLKGPAADLKKARKDFIQTLPQLPNFVIYGWETKPVTKYDSSGVPQTNQPGYWHLVRVEAFAPKRCYQQCGPSGHVDQFPKVETYTDWDFGWMGLDQIRCYEMRYHTGIVMARVTRYDEDHDMNNVIKFPNGNAIWRFKYTNSSNSAADAVNLGRDCQLQSGELEGTSTQTKAKLLGAFMINKVPSGSDSTICWQRANALLDRGVESRACATYYWMGDVSGYPDGMGIKFLPPGNCPFDTVLGQYKLPTP